MDYQTLLEKTKQELEQLKTQDAVCSAKIKDLAESLGLDSSKDLKEQASQLLLNLEKEEEQLKENLNKVVKSLEELNG